jgi:hypothetical protein
LTIAALLIGVAVASVAGAGPSSAGSVIHSDVKCDSVVPLVCDPCLRDPNGNKIICPPAHWPPP